MEELSNEGDSQVLSSESDAQWGRAIEEKMSRMAQPFNLEDAVNVSHITNEACICGH